MMNRQMVAIQLWERNLKSQTDVKMQACAWTPLRIDCKLNYTHGAFVSHIHMKNTEFLNTS